MKKYTLRYLLLFVLVCFLLFSGTIYAYDGDTIVYITNTGSKYHRLSCGYLKSINEITLYDAVVRGYEPCSACTPPTLIIEYNTPSPTPMPQNTPSSRQVETRSATTKTTQSNTKESSEFGGTIMMVILYGGVGCIILWVFTSEYAEKKKRGNSQEIKQPMIEKATIQNTTEKPVEENKGSRHAIDCVVLGIINVVLLIAVICLCSELKTVNEELKTTQEERMEYYDDNRMLRREIRLLKEELESVEPQTDNTQVVIFNNQYHHPDCNVIANLYGVAMLKSTDIVEAVHNGYSRCTICIP